MAVSTTQAIWRSGGGDQTRTAYAGSGVMAAVFAFSATQTSGNVTNGNGQPVILPAGAIITEVFVNAAGTGGTSPTFDLGFTPAGGTAQPQGILNEADADAGKQFFTWATATVPGAYLGAPLSATALSTITGRAGASAATGGTITGTLIYYVADPLFGQQNV